MSSSDTSNSAAAYTVEVRENDQRLSMESIVDPFIHTRVRPRGWRVALAVLRRRYEIVVIVGGDRERVEEVMKLDPDYLGPHNRAEFMQGLLGDFVAQIEEHEL